MTQWASHQAALAASVTTGFTLPNARIVHNLGIVRGLTVRSRSAIGQFGANIQQMFGGNITLYSELAEHARQEAFDLMLQHAAQMGANAVIGMRYDANEITDGVTEVLAYGTAVVVEWMNAPVQGNPASGNAPYTGPV